MPSPAKYVQPIHFEDFSGAQFERLVFAFHARDADSTSISQVDSAPLVLATWYASQGELELRGRSLSIAAKEVSRAIRHRQVAKIDVRLREAEELAAKIASTPIPSDNKLAMREKRYQSMEQLDELRRMEQHLSTGVTLMLSEPDIAPLIIDDDPATCISSWVQGYIRHLRGIVLPSQTKYVIYPPKHRKMRSWISLTPAEKREYEQRIRQLMQKFQNPRIGEMFWDLPPGIRSSKGVPAFIDALLRAIETDGESLHVLRKDGSMHMMNWHIFQD